MNPARSAVIVGGGIGGGTLANLLAARGWNVTVLERSVASVRMERPEVLWPVTLRLLESIVGAAALNRALVPVEGMRVYRSGRLRLAVDTPRKSTHPAAGAASTDPNEARRLLLESDTFEVRRGTEVADLLRDGGRVVGVRARRVADGAQTEIRADWVIADDGTHSAVRSACEIACPVTMLPIELLCFGFQWPTDFPPARGHVFVNERWNDSGIFLMVAAPFPNGRGAGLVTVRPGVMQDPTRAAREFGRFLANDPRAAKVFGHRRFPEDVVRVRTGFGLAERYGDRGVLLLGDAAHPVTPAGGQGANLSVNDAACLARLLIEAHPDVPAGYERLRRPAAQRSLRLSRGAARALRLPDPVLSRLALLGLALVRIQPRLFSPVLRVTSTSFVRNPPPRLRVRAP